MAHSGQELLKTADNKRPASTESDPSDLVRAGEKRRRLREIASPSVTWIIIQKVEELAAQLLSDATSLDDHVEHQFQTDGVHTSELDTFNTLLSEAVRFSEKSNTKCIGITIETRPDYCLKKHLSAMLSYGCTRLEIGVQSVYEDVARDTNRGDVYIVTFIL